MATGAQPRNVPLVLIIRDGWGENPHPEHDRFNAVKLARKPCDDALRRDWPWTLIKTSGEDVGLPEGTMGNSEVGHQNIGAGRVVPQESLVMTEACKTGLEKNPAIRAAIERCLPSITGRATVKREDRHGAVGHQPALHLMGINSDAGVHGLLEHLYAILRACKTLGLTERVHIHLFTDGRDTGPFTGLGYAQQVEARCRAIGVGRIASVVGRYYAMDRDYRWERVQRAYTLLTDPQADPAIGNFPSVRAAIQDYYDRPTSPNMAGDEFITARTVAPDGHSERGAIKDGDSVIFYNYRGDRPREISAAFVFPDEQWAKVKPSPDSGRAGFDRGPRLSLEYVTMTDYWGVLKPFVKVAFPKPPRLRDIAGEYISRLGLRQFRCAETEKYPHVTFFFNDYRDPPFEGEQRDNPQSPRVATYDLKPEMSAAEVRDAVLRRLAAPDCEPFIVVNFANGDMVGHTGNLPAAIKAVGVVDQCVGAIVERALHRGGALIITADHGNCEQMWDPKTNAPHTAHTVYDVPLYIVGASFKGRRLRGDTNAAGWFDSAARAARGRLADIAPTALEMMGLDKPTEMTGGSLLL